MKRIFFFIFLFFICFNVFGQDLNLPKSIQSPNASSLGKYGDVPVSYYAGTPNVSIPLYSINEYGIPLDINLNYDSSGVRVNSMPGWVGQNWSLQAGGMITRTVKGNDFDEFYLPPSIGNTYPAYGYYHSISHNLLNISNWNSESYLNDLWNYKNSTMSGISREYEPDLFTFNFMGYTGKFFMGQDGLWKVSSSSNLKISIEQGSFKYPFDKEFVPFNDNSNVYSPSYTASKTIYKISITDDKGNMYIFGNTNNSIEYSVPFFTQFPGRWTADTWYLTEVKNRFEKVIYSFEYERDDYIASFYKYYRKSTFDATINGGSSFLGMGYDCLTDSNNYSHPVNGALISPVYLKKIITEDDDIIFSRNLSYGKSYNNDSNLLYELDAPEFMPPVNDYFYYYLLPYSNINDVVSKLKWKKLFKIEGANKIINLNYNETQPYTGGINERLNLMNVSIDDKTYKFEYNGIENLPDFLSTKIDHWGYYDGSDWIIDPETSHYNSREPHSENVKKGSLTKIIYPTKGWTEFIWQANNYSGYVSDNKSQVINTTNTLAGGLKIQKIKDNDGLGNEIIREFKYVKDYPTNQNSTISSGIIESKPKYSWDNYKIISYQSASSILYEDLFSTNPILPLANYSGTHIGYSEVIEKRSDGSYTLYKYTSNNNILFRDDYNYFSLNPDPTPYSNYSDKSLLRGKLKEIHIYDSDNNLVESTINSYDYNSNKFVKSVDVVGEACPGSPGNGFLKGSASKIYYFDNNLINKEITSYREPHLIKNTTTFGWDYYPSANTSFGDQFLQTKQFQTYLNQGDTNQIFYKEDYTYSFELSTPENSELTNQRYFTLLQTDVFKNQDKLGSNKVEYSFFGTTVLPAKYYISKGEEPLDESIIIDAYNSNQQVIQYHKKNGMYTTISYVDKYPVIKLEGEYTVANGYIGMITSQIASIVNSSGWNGGKNQIIAKQQEARDYYSSHMVNTYTYDPNVGLTSVTGSNGKTEHYSYDSSERLNRIKDNDNNTIKQFIYNIKPQ